MDLRVDRIERHPVRVPFRDGPGEHLRWQLPEWRYFEVVEVELAEGSVGYGESTCFYTWGRTADGDVERARGANAPALLWDDSLGAGLQIALFDAVGRALGVPVHALLGEQAHERTPVAWWCLDYPAEDWVAECERAVEAGYAAVKLKGRPWRDVRAQVEAVCAAVPGWFEVGLDFNGTLLDADRAVPLLRELEAHTQVGRFESPIPHDDIEGYRRVREAVDAEVVQHYGGGGTPETPEPLVAVREDVCDGFVLTGGASHLRDAGAVAAMAGADLWLQLVGTGITAAFSLHCGGVLERATWPAVNCHQLFADDLLADPIAVEDGTAAVPDGPGLGHGVDRDALAEYRTEIPDSAPESRRLVRVTWPDGPTMYFDDRRQLWRHSLDDGLPDFFARGVESRAITDDGSERWVDLHERARESPVVEDGLPEGI